MNMEETISVLDRLEQFENCQCGVCGHISGKLVRYDKQGDFIACARCGNNLETNSIPFDEAFPVLSEAS